MWRRPSSSIRYVAAASINRTRDSEWTWTSAYSLSCSTMFCNARNDVFCFVFIALLRFEIKIQAFQSNSSYRCCVRQLAHLEPVQSVDDIPKENSAERRRNELTFLPCFVWK